MIDVSDKEKVRALVAADGPQRGFRRDVVFGAALQISAVMPDSQLRKMHQQRQQSCRSQYWAGAAADGGFRQKSQLQ